MRFLTGFLLAFLSMMSFTNDVLASSEKGTLYRELVSWFQPRTSEKVHQGQYLRQDCTEADLLNFPQWKGLPVQKCQYTETLFKIPVTTTAYVLYPDADMLATWILEACEFAQVKDLRQCTGRLSSRIWLASNAMFPVAGYVVEGPMDKSFKYQDRPYCYLFRDGVTVTTRSWPDTSVAVNHVCGPEVANTEEVSTAKKYARIGSTNRAAYIRALGGADVGTEGARSPQWAAAAGAAFKEAWLAPKAGNLLLRGLVKDLNKCDGNIWETPIKPKGC